MNANRTSITFTDRSALLCSTSLALLFVLLTGATPLRAQTVDVTAPGSLTAAAGTTTPANVAIWNLQSGGVFLDSVVTLPAGTPGLAINGNGNTLTLNDGAATPTYGRFANGTTGPVTLNLSNITLTGGLLVSSGGTNVGNAGSVISDQLGNFTGVGVILNVAGNVTLSNNSVIAIGGPNGGAIESNSSVTILGGVGSAFTLSGNSAVNTTGSNNGEGGAIYTLGDVNISFGAGSVITLSDNFVTGAGGGIYAIGNVNISSGDGGDITLSGNQATSIGGAISTSVGNVSISNAVDGAIAIKNNSALTGGAIALRNFGNVTIGNPGAALTITGNRAIYSLADASFGDGGAIATLWGGDTTIIGHGILGSNTADHNGGAIMTGVNWTAFGFPMGVGGIVTLTSSGGDLSVTGNSAGGLGGAIYTDGTVEGSVALNAVDGNIIFRGNTQGTAATPQANAIYFNNTSGTSQLTLNTAASNAISFFDPVQNNALNGLLTVNKTGAGSVVFDGSDASAPTSAPAGSSTTRWSQVYGNTTLQAGTFAVQNNAVYGALAADVGGTAGPSSFAVNSGATLAGGILGEVRADNFTLGGTLNIAGFATPGTPAGGFSTFAVTSNNVSLGGGTVLFNTTLNDASVQRSDLLVLNLNGSATSGTANIAVTNAGGGGALTVGNGIQLVQTNNGTSTGAFALGNRAAAGAYEYLLFQGGVGADAGNQNWYLRSQLDCTLPGASATAECAGGGEVPIYRPEVIVDTAIPALASRFGLGMLGTWHERTGGEFATNYVTADGHRQAGWGRIFGDIGRYGMGFGGSVGDRSVAFSSHGPSYDFTFGGIQAGMDLLRRENGDGSRDLAGFYVGAGSARADVRSVIDFGFGANAGRVSMDGYSLGGYYTHIGQSGWYVDAVLQGTYYADIAATSNINEAQTLKTHGTGVLASLEGGYPIALGGGFTFEPQAQLVYQHLGFGDGADKFGQIAFSDSDAWYGRLSGRLSRDWTREDGRKVMAWARAGVWTDFGAQAKTTFSNLEGLNPTSFGTDLGGRWAQLDLGVSAQLSDKVSVFTVGPSMVSLSGPVGHSFGGRAGLKVAW
jgi:outer membrane autotransporter protein